ncbi:hypothetical protein DPEC_G00057260 [Dallia pectoralis]|uniref:Uncharacterized protein n=1 Tax=Dallia pectoralis TaxID=75939 RepID=A0ACC2H6H6_DALPE|nr:hypothetical protein DPEC_G00057260 [Dallia pectoralis]
MISQESAASNMLAVQQPVGPAERIGPAPERSGPSSTRLPLWVTLTDRARLRTECGSVARAHFHLKEEHKQQQQPWTDL